MRLPILQLSCRLFFGKASHHPGLSAPLQPRFGSLRLLTFPKAKIAVERKEICECDSHTVHKLSQRRLTAEWLAPWESDCSRMSSKVSSDWLPSNMKATRPVLEIFKMAGYFPDSPHITTVLTYLCWTPLRIRHNRGWTVCTVTRVWRIQGQFETWLWRDKNLYVDLFGNTSCVIKVTYQRTSPEAETIAKVTPGTHYPHVTWGGTHAYRHVTLSHVSFWRQAVGGNNIPVVSVSV